MYEAVHRNGWFGGVQRRKAVVLVLPKPGTADSARRGVESAPSRRAREGERMRVAGRGERIALVALLGAAVLGCAQLDSAVQEARRAVHQKCHSEYNSCRQAAGANASHRKACQQDLDACLARPATD